MSNDINANIKEILKEVSIKGLFDVKLTSEEEKLALLGAMATPFGTYYIENLKGKSNGRDAQVNQAAEVGASQSVEEKAKELGIGLEDASNCEDVSGSKVSFPSATAPKNSKGSTIGK
ncbi:hypothetical protein [Wolbachia endosymbiont of Folsomia candida]|uniref:hypothetical protein n=1 Tax=Wolbachia endosymbiont of Folsomia candida TaxID=169402 RepID=UPI000B15934A|nr:hypothetical protein [Wolbachia endosymbiont of Folsomia candida]APR98763.1 hypothetical protein ASM33_06015 [Wolbachia endosymbiont of Folsomia candida]